MFLEASMVCCLISWKCAGWHRWVIVSLSSLFPSANVRRVKCQRGQEKSKATLPPLFSLSLSLSLSLAPFFFGFFFFFFLLLLFFFFFWKATNRVGMSTKVPKWLSSFTPSSVSYYTVRYRFYGLKKKKQQPRVFTVRHTSAAGFWILGTGTPLISLITHFLEKKKNFVENITECPVVVFDVYNNLIKLGRWAWWDPSEDSDCSASPTDGRVYPAPYLGRWILFLSWKLVRDS